MIPKLESRLHWRGWLTPASLKAAPRHRWFTFPHSYAHHLVKALIDEWNLSSEDHILDPFVGAGTTALSSLDAGVNVTGYDISPLSIFVTKAKTNEYNVAVLKQEWKRLQRAIHSANYREVNRTYADLITKAMSLKTLQLFELIDEKINKVASSESHASFFRLGLISILSYFSYAVPSGGWLRWSRTRYSASEILPMFESKVISMLFDVESTPHAIRSKRIIKYADARYLPEKTPIYSTVITSPPYPNRHDYTRVFGIELLYGFLDWDEVRSLRYQTLHSHPESRPLLPDTRFYKRPRILTKALSCLSDKKVDNKVALMLDGYFRDIYICLRELSRATKHNARICYILGNVQYLGVQIPVDEITALIGEQVNLRCETLAVVRYRGNSAQQMGRSGRTPTRESLIIFRNREGATCL